MLRVIWEDLTSLLKIKTSSVISKDMYSEMLRQESEGLIVIYQVEEYRGL